MECQGMGKDQEGRGRLKVNLRLLAEVTVDNGNTKAWRTLAENQTRSPKNTRTSWKVLSHV